VNYALTSNIYHQEKHELYIKKDPAETGS